MGTYADAVRRKWDDAEAARQLKIDALKEDMKHAPNGDAAQQILSTMTGILQPHEGHHVIGALRGLVERLGGKKQDQQQPAPAQPADPGMTFGAPPAAAPPSPTGEPPTVQPGPGFTLPPSPAAPVSAAAPAAPVATPTAGATPARGGSPAPGSPARPVPPGMKAKTPPVDPAIAMFGKYWQSPAKAQEEKNKLVEQQAQQQWQAFQASLDRAEITDPKEREALAEDLIRSQFDMKTPARPLAAKWQNIRLSDGKMVSMNTNAPDFQMPPGAKIESSTRKVANPAASLGVPDALKLAAQGKVFPDEDGNPIDLSKLEPGMKLVPVYSGSEEFYQVADQQMRQMTFNGRVYQEPQFGQLQGPGQATPLGLAPSGMTRASTSTVQDPSGQQILSATHVTAPQIPGVPRAAAGAPAAAVPGVAPAAAPAPRVNAPAPGGAHPVPPGLRGAAQPPQTKVEANLEQDVKQRGVTPNIEQMKQHLTPANARLLLSQWKASAPALTALQGMYGDPQYPEIKSLADFAYLADDPHAKDVLGEAFTLLKEDASMTATDPGVLDTIKTVAGFQNYYANQLAKVQQRVGDRMTPQEKEYFNTAIAGMADIIGARSATGSPAAKFSIDAIQTELPLIGLSSTTDKDSYLTKMLTIAKQVGNGLVVMPDNARALWWLQKRLGDLQKQRGNKGPAPGGQARPAPPGSKPVIVVTPEKMAGVK